MAPAHHTKLQQHGPILGTAAQCGRGVCILDTCSGLSTSVSAAMRAGLSVASYVAVEKEERVRTMASHHLRQLHLKYGPARLPVEAFSAAFTTLPQDMTEVTEEHIRCDNLGVRVYVLGGACDMQPALDAIGDCLEQDLLKGESTSVLLVVCVGFSPCPQPWCGFLMLCLQGAGSHRPILFLLALPGAVTCQQARARPARPSLRLGPVHYSGRLMK